MVKGQDPLAGIPGLPFGEGKGARLVGPAHGHRMTQWDNAKAKQHAPSKHTVRHAAAAPFSSSQLWVCAGSKGGWGEARARSGVLCPIWHPDAAEVAEPGNWTTLFLRTVLFAVQECGNATELRSVRLLWSMALRQEEEEEEVPAGSGWRWASQKGASLSGV